MIRCRAFVIALVGAGLALAACCADGKCIKDPPCRPGENPCCLTPLQKAALGKGTHALVGPPVVYAYEGKTYFLFTESGLKEFEKDPAAFEEKGAVRLGRGGQLHRADMNPGDDFDWRSAAATSRPFSPAPVAPK